MPGCRPRHHPHDRRGTVELIYPGPNHEVGNILVWFPGQKLAMMSDLVMPGWAPYGGWGNADYPPGILFAHDAILALDFETYVGGHVYRTDTAPIRDVSARRRTAKPRS